MLGALQGVAEFLPISSSGHLRLLQSFMGLQDVPLLFDVLLHLATLLVVCIFFRKRIWELLCAFFRFLLRKKAPELVGLSEKEAQDIESARRRYILGIIIVTFITGIIGVITKKVIPELPLQFICAGFLITACLLILSAIISRNSGNNSTYNTSDSTIPKIWQSVVIGLMQGIGTLPGVSRSGSTIAGALFCGVERKMAGEFSFIVSIPAILGAFILELKDLDQMTSTISFSAVVAGLISAFIAGYGALTLLMKIIKKGHLEWFALYLIPVGMAGLFFLK